MFHGGRAAGGLSFWILICSIEWQSLSLIHGAFVGSCRHQSCRILPFAFTHRCRRQELRSPCFRSSVRNDHHPVDEQQVLVVNGDAAKPTKTSPTVYEFCQKIQHSVSSDPPQLVSLLLQGSSRRSKDNEQQQQQQQRGAIRQVQGRLITITTTNSKKKQEEVMLQLTFKYHGATDICKNLAVSQAIAQTLMAIFYPSHMQSPAFTLEEISSEWGLWSHDVGTSPFALQSAQLTLTNGTCWNLRLGSKSPPRLEKTKAVASNTASFKPTAEVQQQPPQPGHHDRVKSVLIASSASFLQALGVTNEHGQPKNGVMASKLRQCQKFVEITSRLISTALEQQSTTASTTTTPMMISTTDMGCGRGYLTFALHSYLMQQYGMTRSSANDDDAMNDSNHRVYRVCTRGIDVRPKLVQEISHIAQSLGPAFEGLTFETGSIDSGNNNPHDDLTTLFETTTRINPSTSTLEVLIALHACDTATDDALWWGISRQVNVIVVAPCCHKQVRPQLNQFVRQLQQQRQTEPLLEILRHGIYRERMAETLTDSMRALLLELANYQVQVFEFIGGEDTSKNVMITAVQRSQPRTDAEMQQLQQRICTMAATYGIGQQQLAMKMGINLVSDEASKERADQNAGMMSRRRANPTSSQETESSTS